MLPKQEFNMPNMSTNTGTSWYEGLKKTGPVRGFKLGVLCQVLVQILNLLKSLSFLHLMGPSL